MAKPIASKKLPTAAPTSTAAAWAIFQKRPALCVFLFAVLLYANTLGHQFTQDDAVVITQNTFVKQGFAGLGKIFGNDTFAGFEPMQGQASQVAGGRYRPLSLGLFAVLFQFVGANPKVFHGLSILLYALVCALAFRVLRRVLPDFGWAGLFAVALLFAAHPVHTEVVANVKGCDETLAMLLALLAWGLVFRVFDSGKKQGYGLAAALFFLACLAKESVLFMAALVPLSLWFFRKTTWRETLPAVLALGAGAVAYLLARGGVVGWSFATPQHDWELMNHPFLKYVASGSAGQWVPFSAGEKNATILYGLGRYLGLMLWPHPLTSDYYPRHIGIMTFGGAGVWLSILGLAALVGLAWRGWRGRRAYSFGIAFFLVNLLLVANIFFSVGVHLAERFLFLPSLGLLLAGIDFLKNSPSAPSGFGSPLSNSKGSWAKIFGPFWLPVGLVCLLFSLKTISRNRDWKDNFTLATADVQTSANSAKSQYWYGTQLLDRALKMPDGPAKTAQLRAASEHLSKSIEIHPTFYDAFLARGAAVFYLGEFESAADNYRHAGAMNPADQRTRVGLAYSLRAAGFEKLKLRDTASARGFLSETLRLLPGDTMTLRGLGQLRGGISPSQ